MTTLQNSPPLSATELKHIQLYWRVACKQPAPQWLSMDAAVKHCSSGIGILEWAAHA